MANGTYTRRINNNMWLRIRAILLCLLALIFVSSTTIAVFAEAVEGMFGNLATESRERTKTRLMWQIKYQGWDPYSSDMTLNEYYALAELFNEGKLPLKNTPSISLFNKALGAVASADEDKDLVIPRKYFMLTGLPDDAAVADEAVQDKPLVYKRANNYEPYDPITGEAYSVIKVENPKSEDYKDQYQFSYDGYTYEFGDDGRLYATSVSKEDMVQYDYAFEHVRTKTTYVRLDDNKLYEVGTTNEYQYDTDVDTENGKAHLFRSIATDKVYIVDNKNGLFEYVETATDKTGAPFSEASGDYYYINGYLYQFKDNALFVAGTKISSPYIKGAFLYPAGFGVTDGYMRPQKDWAGITVRDKKQAFIVSDGINNDNYAVSGNVDQTFFKDIAYNGYYVKQVSIDGANVNVLGIIEVTEGNTTKYVYYYLSAEEQSTQVSTTTLSDDAKFVIEFTPNEHQVTYQVMMANEYAESGINGKAISSDIPSNVVFYGSNSASTLSWVDSIFGTTAQRPSKTVGGAYSFDVVVPYGYELQIIISVDRAIPGTFKDANGKDITGIPTFHVDVNHTASRAVAEDTWLTAYGKYLADNGVIPKDSVYDGESFSLTKFKSTYIQRTPNKDGNDRDYSAPISYKWKKTDDVNAKVHNDTFELIAARVNDMAMHNSARTSYGFDGSQTGYPLGKEPLYDYYPGDGGFNVYSNVNGPEVLTMNDTFYNHQVKASRLITAVLTKKTEPVFDVRYVIQRSSGAADRGSIASYNNAMNADEDYEYHVNGGADRGPDDPVKHSASFPNVETADGWKWTNTTNSQTTANKERVADKEKTVTMAPNSRTGTYSYSWMFQTNDGSGGYVLDAFAVNGIAVVTPIQPKYTWRGSKLTENSKVSTRTPYYTEITLVDGATLRLEYLLGGTFPGKSVQQRHYRVTVVGARANVTITGLNLMQGTGAAEFSVSNLVGVYKGEGSQTSKAVQYYSKAGSWEDANQAEVVVQDTNATRNINVNRDGGATNQYGANIRFKVADGYGNPYYMWLNRNGDPISTSATLNDNGEVASFNDPISLAKATKDDTEKGKLVGGKLDPNFVYYDDDGYYYIRVEKAPNDQDKDSEGNKINNIIYLNIIARTIKYAVRYVPSSGSGVEEYFGFLIDETTNLVKDDYLTVRYAKSIEKDFALKAGSMPSFDHNPNICALWEMAKVNGQVPVEIEAILHQFDDHGGSFYDLIYNRTATIATSAYGTISPVDSSNSFAFVSWVLVDKDFKPLRDENNDYIYFTGGAIDLNIYSKYAVLNAAFGTDDTDLYVIRLMPVWREVSHPYYYNVVLNWIDATGKLQMENFTNWDKVLTEMLDDNTLFVYLNKDADPLKDWVAQHPTYSFWDAVNNAKTIFKENGDKDLETNTANMQAALEAYLQRKLNFEQYPEDKLLLEALVNRDYTGRDKDGKELELGKWEKNDDGTYSYTGGNGVDDFDRLSDDIFKVNEDCGTICIWMYENKGGLIFHKEVQGEPFEPNDEFYFEIQNVGLITSDGTKLVTDQDKLLTGEYKAYPQTFYNEKEGAWGFYDDEGNFRAATDNDAWLVTFEEGVVKSVKKIGSDDEPTTYFKLKNGDGIALYVPEGQYNVVEVGSRSGGGYKADVKYLDGAGKDITVEKIKLFTEKKDENGKVVKDEHGNAVYNDKETEIPKVQFPKVSSTDGELWLKGSETTYLDKETKAGVSQIPVIVTFKLGENEVIQTITFYNKTTSLSIELGLHQNVTDELLPKNPTLAQQDAWNNAYLYYDYGFVVVFALPSGGKPLIKKATSSATTRAAAGEIYYFNMNVYWEEDGEEKSRAEEVEFVQLTKDNKDLPYIDKAMRDGSAQENYTDGIDSALSKENSNLWIAKVTLRPGERCAFIMQVMTGAVNYWVDESLAATIGNNNEIILGDKLDNGLMPGYSGRSGTAEEGKVAYTKVTNMAVIPKEGFLAISVKGGKATESFVFKVTNTTTNVSIYVTVKGGETTLIYAPAGTYTVTLVDTWSWRYNVAATEIRNKGSSDSIVSSLSATVEVGANNNTEDVAVTIVYTAADKNSPWLGGEGSGKK